MFATRDAIIATELNPAFVMSVIYNVPPGIVVLYIMVSAFLASVMMFYIFHSRKNRGYNLFGAYEVWLATTIVSCFIRPLCGLTWYFKSGLYNNLMLDALSIETWLLVTMIILLIAGSVYGKPVIPNPNDIDNINR
jgi:hypothetical protein